MKLYWPDHFRIVQKYGTEVWERQFQQRVHAIQLMEEATNEHDRANEEMNASWMHPDDFEKDLQDVKEVLEKIGIPFWMQYGVLLGQVRSGEYMFWEHDIDVGTFMNIDPKDMGNWRNILENRFKEFWDRGFTIDLRAKRLFGHMIKIKRNVTIDIFMYEEYKGRWAYSDYYNWADYQSWDKDMFKEFVPMNFNGVFFPVPKDYKRLLEIDYGDDWKTIDGEKKPKDIMDLPYSEFIQLKHKFNWRDEISDRNIISNTRRHYKMVGHKLNLGGEDTLGYSGVDVNKNVNGANVSFIIDMETNNLMSTFDPESCEEIMSAHFLEHLTLRSAYKILENCFEMLKPGKKLLLQVPNGELTKEQNQGVEYPIKNHFERYDHKVLYTYKILEKMLKEIGFKEVRPLTELNPYFKRLDYESISLEAIK